MQLTIHANVNDRDAPLSALADPTRRRVVYLLTKGPRRAGELAAATRMSGPALSRHLRGLRSNGIVETESGDDGARVRIYRPPPEPFVAPPAWLDQRHAFWA